MHIKRTISVCVCDERLRNNLRWLEVKLYVRCACLKSRKSKTQILSPRQRVGLAGLTRNKSAELVETLIEIINGIREKDNEVLINRFAEFEIWITILKRFFKTCFA
jgi:hypothetical protein